MAKDGLMWRSTRMCVSYFGQGWPYVANTASPWMVEGTIPGKESVDCVGNKQSRATQDAVAEDVREPPSMGTID